MLSHQVEEIRSCMNVLTDAEREIQLLKKRRTELFEIESMIQRYADRVDLDGYSLKAKIARVIEWSKSGKFAKG